ncbi:MAG: FHA domain-containing protein [Proteobacteria bacterium]|nr:FHA domain-containing protein [Pseudomonadota bacterium]
MFKLVIQDDEGKTTVVPLIRDEITIGRKEGNTIRLTERNVSRRHARIVRNNGEVQIEDLGSYNGIRVNNARIAERVSLRISDQVQIGDYKLYLKAEGVEQVDDARTMPIERVDVGNATDVIPAVAAPATAPMAAASATSPTSGLASAPGSPQLVGHPARTLVAIGDTDPAGRPVATAATVAALNAPVGYGKLVVVSSNFAGKEFELSRPQMIVGRTDENDLCINHRSISRNHAKLVREPETGRYTISDLQSSNGVRVNGQDYGKVELRRGDVVDLGHVRLRFVEPGEDFVFARDAVITDVPDTGKKGMMVAVVLGAIVLAAVIIFFVTRKTDGDKPGGNGMVDKVVLDAAGDKVALGSNPPNGSNGSADVVDPGSGSSGTAPTLPPDAGTGSAVASNEQENKCAEYKKDRKWVDMQTCANSLVATNPARAKELDDKAVSERKAQTQSEKVTENTRAENLEASAAALNKIPKDSVYYAEAQGAYNKLEAKILKDFTGRARMMANDKKCDDLKTLVRQAPSQIQDDLRRIQCDDKRVGPGSNVVVTPPAACTPEVAQQYFEKANTAFTSNQDQLALSLFEKAYACRGDANSLTLAVITACRSGNVGKAKVLFAKLPASRQAQAEGRCATFKIPVR